MFPELLDEGLEPFEIPNLWLSSSEPDTYVDAEKFADWIRKGARPSESVEVMMAKHAPSALRPVPLLPVEPGAVVEAEEMAPAAPKVKKAKKEVKGKKAASKGARKPRKATKASEKKAKTRAKAKAKKASGIVKARKAKKPKKSKK